MVSAPRVSSSRDASSSDGGSALLPRVQDPVAKRKAPYGGAPDRSGNHRAKAPHVNTEDTDMIKVSAASDTRSVAGKIAYDCREKGRAPTLLTIGAPSINTALKAICVARKWLQAEGKDLCCQPAFREGMSELALAIYVWSVDASAVSADLGSAAELTAKATTKRSALAGAVAARAREREPCCVVAKGADAVAAAASGICRARSYLEGDALDVRCFPEFLTREHDGLTSNYLRIALRSEVVS